MKKLFGKIVNFFKNLKNRIFRKNVVEELATAEESTLDNLDVVLEKLEKIKKPESKIKTIVKDALFLISLCILAKFAVGRFIILAVILPIVLLHALGIILCTIAVFKLL